MGVSVTFVGITVLCALGFDPPISIGGSTEKSALNGEKKKRTVDVRFRICEDGLGAARRRVLRAVTLLPAVLRGDDGTCLSADHVCPIVVHLCLRFRQAISEMVGFVRVGHILNSADDDRRE